MTNQKNGHSSPSLNKFTSNFAEITFETCILQVAKASSVKDVIVQALAKNRKDSESERKSSEDYVLVEEVDVLDSSRKANKCNKMKRILDPSENVYLIQL